MACVGTAGELIGVRWAATCCQVSSCRLVTGKKKPRTWRGLGVGFSGREQLRTSKQSLQLQGATATQCDFTSDFRVVYTADLTTTLSLLA